MTDIVETTTKPIGSTAVVKSQAVKQAVWDVANHAVKSGLYPKFRTPEAAFMACMTGMDLGLSLSAAIIHVNVIDGSPELSAAAMQTLAMRAGVTVIPVQKTREGATVKFVRNGQEYTETFDKEDAQAAGLLKPGRNRRGEAYETNWQKWPKAMYWARALSAGIRTFCPDVTMGYYVAGEISGDLEAPPAELPTSQQIEIEVQKITAARQSPEEIPEEYLVEAAFERAALPKKKKKAKPKAAALGGLEPQGEEAALDVDNAYLYDNDPEWTGPKADDHEH